MLHNTRREPPAYWTNYRKERFWKEDAEMTVSIAAACQDNSKPRIVTCADKRIETDYAGGDIDLKYERLADAWGALYADDPAKVYDFTETCREVLAAAEKKGGLTGRTILDRLNEASSAHKQKLIDRFCRRRLGVHFRHFRSHQQDWSNEAQHAFWNEVYRIELDSQLIVFGFADGLPRLFRIESDGEVSHESHFATIGSGRVIADAMLFYREQNGSEQLNRTLYNVYEAARMTYDGKSPGVGKVELFCVFEPDDTGMRVRAVQAGGTEKLKAQFGEFGPKAIDEVGLETLTSDDFALLNIQLKEEPKETA